MQTFHVAFASDNNYAQHMAVSIASLLKNIDANMAIHIYILYEDLENRHIDNLKRLTGLHKNTEIEFLKLSLDDFSGYPLHTKWHSIATYFRLKLPSLLPHIEHIAYLDSDIVVCEDISNIWKSFISENVMLQAVEEPTPLYGHRLESLGMRMDSPYFNGGVLFLNLKKMREKYFESNALSYIQKYHRHIQFQDQDVLNALSEGDWKPLPLRWNSFFFVLEGIYKDKYSLYKTQDVLDAKSKPAIIHFNQNPKPWAEGCIDPRRMEYFKYLEYTPYKGFKVNQAKSIYPVLKAFFFKIVLRINTYFPPLYLLLRSVKRAIVKDHG